MNEAIVTRRQFLAAAMAVPLPGLLHRGAGCEVFTLPFHTWRALASAILTDRHVVIAQDVSSASAAVMASLISDHPSDLAYYRDLYFGIHEPTPEMMVGRLWLSDPRRLERLCVFLRRGGCVVEQGDEWTVLSRSK